MGFNIVGLRSDVTEWRQTTVKSISVPSAIHPYSIAIEYMKDRWFLPKFNGYFKTVHVNGKHVFADQRLFDKITSKQIEKPAVAIVPTVDDEWNRENVDLYQGGLSVYRRPTFDNRILKDDKNHIYLTLDMRQLQMQFAFHIRVGTRAEQTNLMERVKLACRIGSTQGEYIDIDFLLPKDVVLAIASDAGFEIVKLSDESSEVKDVSAFISYLNAHSKYPVTYKFRGITGKKDYFIRVTDCYTHISCLDGLTRDEGERVGQLENNFHIDFTATLQIPMPGLYMYYSDEPHNISVTDQSSVGLYQLVSVTPSNRNDRGRNKLAESDYISDNLYLDEVPILELLESMEDAPLAKLVDRVLHYNVEVLGLSPSMFMEVKLYNDMKSVPFTMDWENYMVNVDQQLKSLVTKVAIYVDTEYVNSTITNLDNLSDENNRLS